MIERRFYIIRSGSPSFAIIQQCIKEIDAAWAARRDFLKKTFGKHAKGTEIIYWGGTRWGLVTKEGELPSPWRRKHSRDGVAYWGPDQRTKEGRAIAKEMKAPRFIVKQAVQIGDAIGVHVAFVDFTIVSPGFIPVRDAFIVQLVKGHKVPADAERISDIEAERLIAELEKPSKKSAAKT